MDNKVFESYSVPKAVATLALPHSAEYACNDFLQYG